MTYWILSKFSAHKYTTVHNARSPVLWTYYCWLSKRLCLVVWKADANEHAYDRVSMRASQYALDMCKYVHFCISICFVCLCRVFCIWACVCVCALWLTSGLYTHIITWFIILYTNSKVAHSVLIFANAIVDACNSNCCNKNILLIKIIIHIWLGDMLQNRWLLL